MHNLKHSTYENIKFLGEGQFATVYKAKNLLTQEIVAIKKIKIGLKSDAADGINRTALREIKLLQELSHTNLINLKDTLSHNCKVSLVFDFMDTDLEVIIKDTSLVLTQANVKCFLLMALNGLEYLHKNWILHRDIKPNNLLVNKQGILKLGDLGLAKYFGSPNRIYTHQVVTRWYRPPELLFGARIYGTSIDIWAMACILAELLLRVPFFPGDSDLDQLSKIFETLGTPNEDVWSGISQLPDYVSFKAFTRVSFKEIFTAADDSLLEILENMFTYNPLLRWDTSQCLKSSYFYSQPTPTLSHKLPLPAFVNEEKFEKGKKRKLDHPHSQHVKRLFE